MSRNLVAFNQMQRDRARQRQRRGVLRANPTNYSTMAPRIDQQELYHDLARTESADPSGNIFDRYLARSSSPLSLSGTTIRGDEEDAFENSPLMENEGEGPDFPPAAAGRGRRSTRRSTRKTRACAERAMRNTITAISGAALIWATGVFFMVTYLTLIGAEASILAHLLPYILCIPIIFVGFFTAVLALEVYKDEGECEFDECVRSAFLLVEGTILGLLAVFFVVAAVFWVMVWEL